MSLWGNRIEKISSLAALTDLEELWLDQTDVSDLSISRGMPRLEILGLSYTQVQDLGPLLDNPELGAGDEIDLRGVPIDWETDPLASAALQELLKRGAIVLWSQSEEDG